MALATNSGGNGYIELRRGNNLSHVYLSSSGNSYLNGGNVGIGTSTPNEALEVNGTIRSKKVKVEAGPWPDYVFESNYELRTLNSLEQYITANKHLPEVPSAAEVEKEGIDLGNMDATLLKKVEELTLYLIEQNKKQTAILKRLDELEKENTTLKAKITSLETTEKK